MISRRIQSSIQIDQLEHKTTGPKKNFKPNNDRAVFLSRLLKVSDDEYKTYRQLVYTYLQKLSTRHLPIRIIKFDFGQDSPVAFLHLSTKAAADYIKSLKKLEIGAASVNVFSYMDKFPHMEPPKRSTAGMNKCKAVVSKVLGTPTFRTSLNFEIASRSTKKPKNLKRFIVRNQEDPEFTKGLPKGLPTEPRVSGNHISTMLIDVVWGSQDTETKFTSKDVHIPEETPLERKASIMDSMLDSQSLSDKSIGHTDATSYGRTISKDSIMDSESENSDIEKCSIDGNLIERLENIVVDTAATVIA